MHLICLILFSLFAFSQGRLNLNSECNCNYIRNSRGSKRQIVNATKVSTKDLQFAAFLFLHQESNEIQKNRYFCGAVLINSEWALSTASCVKQIEKEANLTHVARIGLGGRIDFDTICGVANLIRDVTKFEPHPSFRNINYGMNKTEAAHDIALVKVKKFNLGLNTNIQAPCLFTLEPTKLKKSEFIIPGYKFRKTHWLNDPKSGRLNLYYSKMRMTEEMCKEIDSVELQKSTVCLETFGRSVCVDDYGGPALISTRISNRPPVDKLVLVGIIRPNNFYPDENDECPGKVGFVELLYNHYEWLIKNIKDDMCTPDFAVDPDDPRTLIRDTASSSDDEGGDFPWIIILILVLILLSIGGFAIYGIDTERKKKFKSQLIQMSSIIIRPKAPKSDAAANKAKAEKERAEKERAEKAKKDKKSKDKKSKSNKASSLSRGSNISHVSNMSYVSNPNAPTNGAMTGAANMMPSKTDKAMNQDSSIGRFKPRNKGGNY